MKVSLMNTKEKELRNKLVGVRTQSTMIDKDHSGKYSKEEKKQIEAMLAEESKKIRREYIDERRTEIRKGR